MIFVFSIGWSNYTPYLAKDIIGNVLKKCSSKTQIVDLNNYFFNEIINNATKYFQSMDQQIMATKALEVLVNEDSIKDFDTFLSAQNKLDKFLSTYTRIDSTVSITLDGISYIGITDNKFQVNLDDIFNYIINMNSFLLNKFFENDLVSGFFSEDIIAFSVTSIHQFVSSLYLANILKKKANDITIIVGGNYLSRIYEKLIKDARIFTMVDYLINGCGEEILPLLYEKIKYNKGSLTKIPDIAYFNTETNSVVKSQIKHIELIHESAFCIENCKTKYFSPKQIVPLYVTRGCAWKKCAFCSIPNASGKFRLRNITSVLEDIKKYNKHGITNFNFIDEALTPLLMTKISDAILNEDLDIRWGALARFDTLLDSDLCKKMYDSGCRRLQFGLESYNKNVLAMMNKGINYDMINSIIMNCLQKRISINLFCMIGFPGETEEEARNTIKFVLNIVYRSLHEYGVLTTADFSAFLLDINSNVYHKQREYNIESKPTESESISLYAEYAPVCFDKDALVYDAEMQYSKIIYDYFGKEEIIIENPLYITESYWFLKACQMEDIINER